MSANRSTSAGTSTPSNAAVVRVRHNRVEATRVRSSSPVSTGGRPVGTGTDAVRRRVGGRTNGVARCTDNSSAALVA